MSVNRHQKHILVLPEDDANKDIVNGFVLDWNKEIGLRICPVARGWVHAFSDFSRNYLPDIRNYPECRFVILIDFDNQFQDRWGRFCELVPEELKDRVFLLGCTNEPEDVRRGQKTTFEGIGKMLAEDCNRGTRTQWNRDAFKHNIPELDRLKQSLA